ncbi:methionine synthase [uncultured Duncaniella sp.]|uniref:methionine synthase n=2 Tax=uncultured Duncaniella sp. TaxID=2768039 RepID=UPI0025F3A190|nr:methionine synthase [uncultured Duncaniella sp.]
MRNIKILDGAMGTMIQRRNLCEKDFRGDRFASWPVDLKGNNDVLCITRPDVIEDIHRQYVQAGADIISTDTFNANAISLADYSMSELAREISREGARIARRVADAAGREVLVAGSIGPTNKTASMSPDISDPGMRSVTYDELYDAYTSQIEGLMDGGVDLLLFETVFDTLNLKAGLEAASDVMRRRGREIPVMVSVTIAGKDGRTFSGQTLEAFIASVSHARIYSIGLNCSFGPREIKPWVAELARISLYPVSCHPNAGLPDESGNYVETPESMARVMAELVDEGLVNIIGGCCGTTPEHIAALAAIARGKAPHVPPAVLPQMRLSGLEMLAVTPERNFVNVGERCNVAGSRKFLRLIGEGSYDEAVAIARRQVEDGAQIIDINMDDGLLDARGEMCRFLNLIAAEPDIARVPVMVDSSKWEVIESALKCLQGKGIVNSISLKEGEETFLRRARRIRSLGAAVVVMAFDENGQADTFERKTEVCGRAYRLLTQEAGFPAEDIIFDPNILSIATGIEEHDRYGLDFIRAVRWIKENLPGAKVSGGVSNLSFAFRGNNPLREAMHAVFLYHAVKAGMDMGIVNPASAVTYADIDPVLRDLLEDVILCRREGASEELSAYASAHLPVPGASSVSPVAEAAGWRSLPVGERLAHSLVRGIQAHLGEDISEALAAGMEPVEIIGGPLMEGMNRVGELFGEGKMFLPQVVKTARTMKSAVALLQPEIDRRGSAGASAGGVGSAGKVLIATVKGDVHDIGKNIVAIVLACNNYEVIDLGVMVPAETIVSTALSVRPDIICLSGLITPSLDEMVHVVGELERAGVSTPVMVGGATTSAAHTALKIDPVYRGAVLHVPDASQNPLMASRLLDPATRDAYISGIKEAARRMRADMARRSAPGRLSPDEARALRVSIASAAPEPAFPGRTVVDIPVSELVPLVNWRPFLKVWGLPATLCDAFSLHLCPSCRESYVELHSGKEGREKASAALSLAHDALEALRGFRPAVRGLVALSQARSEGDDIVVSQAAAPATEVRIPTMRRLSPDTSGRCPALADFIAPEGDWIGAFAVSVDAVEECAALRERGDDYRALILQALADRLAEAASEWLHRYVRRKLWGYAPDEPDMTPEELLQGKYRGIRPAMGYNSLPDTTLNHRIALLTGMDGIGVTVTESGALSPSSSVCGLYIAAPEAYYFNL